MRLIDAYKVRCDRDDFDTYADYIKAFDAINEAPTVDAEPVIRCKDCRYYDHGSTWNRCIAHINRYFETCAENYCSWAERKEE